MRLGFLHCGTGYFPANRARDVVIAATREGPHALAGAALRLEPLQQLPLHGRREAAQVDFGYAGIKWLRWGGSRRFPNRKIQHEEAAADQQSETKERHASGITADPMELRTVCPHRWSERL
jgi:hypothetical protein